MKRVAHPRVIRWAFAWYSIFLPTNIIEQLSLRITSVTSERRVHENEIKPLVWMLVIKERVAVGLSEVKVNSSLAQKSYRRQDISRGRAFALPR